MRPFEDDFPYLTKYQLNWVKRFYNSWHFRQIQKNPSLKKRKAILSAYLSGVVDILKDSRNEISFLRRFFDRDGTYTVR